MGCGSDIPTLGALSVKADRAGEAAIVIGETPLASA
jgi:hypothetical protein